MKHLFILVLCVSVFSCKQNKENNTFVVDEKLQKELQEQFILVEDGGTIELPEGNYKFSKSLSMEGKKNITIKGKGVDKTIFSFLGQIEGAEGMNFSNCNAITLENFTIQDAKGDNIKLKGCTDVVIRHMNSTWTTGADSANGNYGYYPVECRNVLIENSEVSYCADAGVYVGQSYNVTVRNCVAHHNVCGIEIENCINVDVHDNLSHNNTGGFVIYDLPGIPMKNGRNCRVFNNIVRENNFKNFAKPGSYVADIPPGSGIIVMAYDSVEVFNNTFENNKTLGCCAVSYYATGRPFTDSIYTPYCTSIYIHDNIFKRKTMLIPDLSTNLGKLIVAMSKGPADIIYDHNYNKAMSDGNGNLQARYKSYFTNNGDIKFFNLNAYKSPVLENVLKTYESNLSSFQGSIPNISGNHSPLKQ
ncbi:MAG: right-handed parallel beta-helix repeat-containing protein [Chitinophagales bacterium]|nr:right-handed parallel beta-helix repeat-containing protein [Chitinophagales bacterium]